MIIIAPKYNLYMPLYNCKIVHFAQSNTRSLAISGDVTLYILFIFWCFNATFSNIFVNYKKGALDSQPQVIKLSSCLPMVGGSLRLLPPLKLVAMIYLKYC
jgi:hypothetical protein